VDAIKATKTRVSSQYNEQQPKVGPKDISLEQAKKPNADGKGKKPKPLPDKKDVGVGENRFKDLRNVF